ncbi:MAG TPA: hypothetical protein DEV81_18460 [Cyanobacteria bacterium UBA11049]|nr:hypothetical protein [Cyanobacteria bacterium UBA11049]
MNKQQEEQVRQWCEDNNWTDLFIHENKFYAFPPHAVIPLPVPIEKDKIERESRHYNHLLYLAITIDSLIILQMLLRFIFLPWLSFQVTLDAIFAALCVLAIIELYTSIYRKYDLQIIFRSPLIIASIFFINYQIIWMLLAYK